MTIAIVTHKVSKATGQGRINYEVAQRAVEAGHEVVLVASAVDDDLQSEEAVTWTAIPVENIPTALLRNQVFAWRSARWLYHHRQSLDVILANGAITWVAADVNVAHFVHSAWLTSPVHTLRVKSGPYAWYQGLYTALNALWERWAFHQAETVIAVSEQVRDELLDIGVPNSKIKVISNGVDLDEFAPGPSERERFGLPEDVPLALLVGDLSTPRKNLDTVLEAIREVPAFHLAVAGSLDGSPYPRLAQRLGVDDRVHFLGRCENMPALMRSVEICLCPSRYEPFSLVLLEALASGCPVITAQTVGAAELVPEGGGWVLETPTDVESIATILHTLAEDVSFDRAKARARKAAEQHDFDQMSEAYLRLLKEHA